MPSNNVQGAGSLYGRLVASRPQGSTKYRSMRSDLAMFGAADLYEYACPLGSQNPQLATNEELVGRAEERVRDWMRNTSERSAAERLASRAHEVFNDEVERRRYDEYLNWCDLRAVFDGLEARLGPAVSSCTTADVAGELARLRELLGSKSQADALMESYFSTRGVEYLDTHDAQVGTAQGRAQVREELAAANVLPDSALQPSTPAPLTQPIVVGNVAPAQVSSAPAARQCVCGAMNPADQRFCQVCGRRLDDVATVPPLTQMGGSGVGAGAGVRHVQTVTPVTPVTPVQPHAERRFPVAAVIVSVVFIVVIAGALAFFLMGGMDGGIGPSSSASSATDKDVERVQSGYVKPVSCSGKTLITPYDVDEEPLDSYRVKLVPKQGGISIDSELLVSRAGSGAPSFSISQFNDSGGKTIEDVPDGQYEVVMTDENGSTVCTFVADYQSSNKKAVDAVEVVATK